MNEQDVIAAALVPNRPDGNRATTSANECLGTRDHTIDMRQAEFVAGSQRLISRFAVRTEDMRGIRCKHCLHSGIANICLRSEATGLIEEPRIKTVSPPILETVHRLLPDRE